MGDFIDREVLADVPLRGLPHEGCFAGLSLVRRERWHWGDLKEDLLGTDLWSRPAAWFISGGEEASLRAAIRWRCSISSGRGGRQASMAKMVIRVEEKQLVTHLWMRLQKESSLSCIFMRGVKRSEPYRRIGAIREVASRWQRYGGRPLPGGERRFTASKAPCARESLRAKWAMVDSEGVNQ